MGGDFAGSSNGRTLGSGPSNLGSNPSPAARGSHMRVIYSQREIQFALFPHTHQEVRNCHIHSPWGRCIVKLMLSAMRKLDWLSVVVSLFMFFFGFVLVAFVFSYGYWVSIFSLFSVLFIFLLRRNEKCGTYSLFLKIFSFLMWVLVAVVLLVALFLFEKSVILLYF